MSKKHKVVVRVQGGNVRMLVAKTAVAMLPLIVLGMAVAIYSRNHHQVLAAREPS